MEQQEAMTSLLEKVGWVQDVIVNRTTGHLIDGHMRVELAMRSNAPTVPVKYVELTIDEERLVLATFDPIAALAFTDRDNLRDLLDEVPQDDERTASLFQQLARRAAPATDTDFLTDFLDPDRDADTKRSTVESSERNTDPGDQGRYIPLSFAVTPEDRDVIQRAIRSARDTHDLSTSNDAIVVIARAYLEDEDAG